MRRRKTDLLADHYSTLEVNPLARLEVIQAAYRALQKIYHPDNRSNGDEQTAKRINLAYEVLSDSTRRADYDHERVDLDGKIVGPYRVLDFIAEGGIGRTYRGEHVMLKTPVCIKHCTKISPVYEQIIIEEAQAAWDMRHYSIPTMRDVLRLDDGSMVLVMSYIPGYTLEQVVEKTPKHRLDAEHTAWIAERLLNALRYMHHHGVIHGDVKPQNVILQHESHMAVLVDYGLAMVKPRADAQAKGYTEYFAPPEQMAGRTLLPESDFYSLGMTMLYMLSGEAERAARKEVPNDTPQPLCDFIMRLVVRDVLSRPRWDRENLCDTIQQVRHECFGRTSSMMKAIPGLD